MRYAVRNLIRIKGKSFLTFIIAFLILFLSMFGVLIVGICEDSRANFWGPLDGSVHVTDETLSSFLTYRTAERIAESSDVIKRLCAYTEFSVHFMNTEHIGTGEIIGFKTKRNLSSGYRLLCGRFRGTCV